MVKRFVVFFPIVMMILQACGSKQDEITISALNHFNRGNGYYHQNNLQAAAEEYKMAIAQDPKQERFYYNLGLVYYSLILYDKAIKSYWQAIELNPEFSEVWYNLALALEKVNETEKAFMAYEKYKKLNLAEVSQEKASPKPVVLSKPRSTPAQ